MTNVAYQNDAAIENAREAIRAQIVERDRCFLSEAPMFPWDRATRALSYVLSMSTRDLRSIRLHCDVFLGTNTASMLYMDFNPASWTALADAYRWLGDGVDPSLWASEPPVPALASALGAPVDGKTINDVTCAIQRYLCNLIRLGISDGDHVVEIGAGYGGLAEAVLRARRVRYTIIDLPETLIFSAAFLMHHFPEKSVYVYRPGDQRGAHEGADLVFLPNYRADWLEPVNLAVNTVSFPEMDRGALRMYVDLLADRLQGRGFLMSCNYHGDRGDGLGVTDFLAARFELHPTPERVMRNYRKSRADYEALHFRPTIICTPRGAPAPRGALRDYTAGERLEFALNKP